MAHINPDKCYTLLPPRPLPVLSGAALALDAVATSLSTHCDKDVSYLQTKLAHFVGSSSTYTYKTQLLEALTIVMMLLSRPDISADERRVITDKLIEGLEHCAPGFHDRLNSIVLGIQRPQNIDEFLEPMRRSIVEGVARNFTQEVHEHNSFFLHASVCGYGIRPINSHDVYSRTLSSQESQTLHKAFEDRYTAMAILNDLRCQLDCELRTYYGYIGQTSEGYTAGTYEKIIHFLAGILDKTLAVDEVFFLTTEYVPFDINWPFIQSSLWKAMQSKDYIRFSEDDVALFEALYHPNADTLSRFLLREPKYKALIHSLKLFQYPDIIKYLSIRHKQILLEVLLEDFSWERNFDAFFNYLDDIRAFSSEESVLRVSNRIFEPHIEKAWLAYMRNKGTSFQFKHSDASSIRLFDAMFKTFPDEKLNYLLTSSPELFLCVFLLAAKHDAQLLTTMLTFISAKAPNRQMTFLTARGNHGFNALIIAARFQPSALPSLLRTISGLDADNQDKIWTSRASRGHDALMLGARFQPSALPSLLTAISSLDADTQNKIWTARNFDEYDALMLAASDQPSALPSLLTAISSLHADTKAKIWTARNNDGYDALMLATRFQPSALPSLLTAISSLHADTKAKILTAKTKDEFNVNVLMLAARYQPSALPSLLMAISSLHADTQNKIWTARTGNAFSDDALMLAAMYQPSALPSLLTAISSLQADTQNKIWTARCNDGLNALMIAAMHQPSALPSLLTAISSLDADTQNRIWTERGNDGFNALMIAARYQSSAVPFLLTAISSLQADTKNKIWAERSYCRHDALMLAAMHQPSAVPSLLTAISSLDANTKTKIWTARNNDEYDALMLAADYQPSAVPSLLTAISSLDTDTQIKFFSSQSWVRYNDRLTSQLLLILSGFDFSKQTSILAHVSPWSRLLFNRKHKIVTDAIDALSQIGPSGVAIQELLQAMKFNAWAKQVRIIEAINEIKKQSSNIESAIIEAIGNPSSQLYKAFSIRRYSLLPLTSETGSLKKMKTFFSQSKSRALQEETEHALLIAPERALDH